MGRPSLHKSEEERRQAKILYMRDYNRTRYTASRNTTNHVPDKELRVDCSRAAYDPQRDGPAEIGSLTALICGDPPKGRSALDRSERK